MKISVTFVYTSLVPICYFCIYEPGAGRERIEDGDRYEMVDLLGPVPAGDESYAYVCSYVNEALAKIIQVLEKSHLAGFFFFRLRRFLGRLQVRSRFRH